MVAKVAIAAPKEMARAMLKALGKTEAEWLGSKTVSNLAAKAASEGYTHFVVMEGVEDRDADVATVLGWVAKQQGITPVYVASGFRSLPSPYLEGLYANGVRHIYARAGEDEAYDFAQGVRNLIENGPDPKITKMLKREEKPASETIQEQVARAASAVRSAQEAADREGGRVDTTATRRIAVVQNLPRDGSTHLAITIAASIRVLGYKTALVVPERHLEQLRQSYRGLEELEAGGVAVGRLAVFAGDTPASAAGDFEYQVCDMDEAVWFWPEVLRGKDPIDEITNVKKAAFEASDLKIVSTTMSPFGSWTAATKDVDGKTLIERMSKRDLERCRIVAWGVDDALREDACVAALARRSPTARFYKMPTVHAPLEEVLRNRRIPPEMARILARTIPAESLRRVTGG